MAAAKGRPSEIMVAWHRANEAGWTDDMICALLEGLDDAIEIEAEEGLGVKNSDTLIDRL